MAHGYYNLKGEFVETATREEATTAWRKERGYSTGGVYDMGGGDVVDTRKVSSPKPSTPTAPAVPQPETETATERNARLQAAFNTASTPATPSTVQATSGWTPAPAVPTTSATVQATSGWTPTSTPTTYDVQSVQSIGSQARQPSAGTPAEQAAAQGGGVPAEINPYFADISSGMQYLYNQWPYNVAGTGTPGELAEGGGYGPSSYQWSESPGSLSELYQGRTPVGPALAAADTVELFLEEFGVRPEFVTSFVQQSLGLTPTDMMSMGYVQDMYARWIALDFGEPETVGGSGEIGGGGYWGGYGGGSGGGYSSPAGFRSGYTSGLINWRIGF